KGQRAPRTLSSTLSLKIFSFTRNNFPYLLPGDNKFGQPHHVAVGFVDGQVFLHYDSHSRKMEPRVSWMEKVGKEDPNYWVRNTQMARDTEEASRGDLETLRLRYNQSKSHLVQPPAFTHGRGCGCELRADGSRGGFDQYGYDGRTFLTLTRRPSPGWKWDTSPVYNRRGKAYLEEICIKWLEKHLSYGKETLGRFSCPSKFLTHIPGSGGDGMETHICRQHGFYPREIDASWTRDGEVWLQDTFHGSVAPNADGTYHYWLSIRIDPKEKGRYRCHVEHDGLQKPLDLALEGERLQGGTGSAVFLQKNSSYAEQWKQI
uniref:Ig-like domain-containing protein n=1 Tax=Naja naja TaxID=35670 RepID=A0A8C6Y4V9_NAJNA